MSPGFGQSGHGAAAAVTAVSNNARMSMHSSYRNSVVRAVLERRDALDDGRLAERGNRRFGRLARRGRGARVDAYADGRVLVREQEVGLAGFEAGPRAALAARQAEHGELAARRALPDRLHADEA